MKQIKFQPTYLYIKTHNKTGLKYFGKTTHKKPEQYRGSGVSWTRHLAEYGNDVRTEIVGFYKDVSECMSVAREFSERNDIVNSTEWANRIPENGIGGHVKTDIELSLSEQRVIGYGGMNTKIYNLFKTTLESIGGATNVDQHSIIAELGITPAKMEKVKKHIEKELDMELSLSDEIELLNHVKFYDVKYTERFFRNVWQPRTGEYEHTGWTLVDEVNALNPQSVLDVGCGYNQFKGRIQNLIGIDPYNTSADYEVDILHYKVKPESHDVILALGSINFNSREDIEERFAHCVSLLKSGGKFFLRANPGHTHPTGPYVDIFNWSFEVVSEFADTYNLTLETFKQDKLNRLYFVYTKK